MVLFRKLKHCYLFSIVWVTSIISLVTNLATSNLALADVDVSPTAPLSGLQKSRQVAQQSNLDVEHVQTTGGNVLSIIMIIGGVLGLGLALVSMYKLYNNIQQGEQARGSNAAYTVGLIIGSLITIVCIIVGVITTYATGNSS